VPLARQDGRPALMPYRTRPHLPIHLENVQFADSESRILLQTRVVHHAVLHLSPFLHVQLQDLHRLTHQPLGIEYDSSGWVIRGARRI
jgi:hypothetical protein